MKNCLMLLVSSSLACGLFVSADPADAGPFDRLRKAVEDVEEAAEDVEEAAEAVETVRGAVEGATSGTNTSSRPGGRRGSDCYSNVSASSNYPCTARAPSHAGRAGEAPARFVSQIQCANLNVGNAFIGRAGDYTFSQGISTESRSGLVERANVEPTNGCFFPGLAVGDVLYVEVDKARYAQHSYKIQCVSYDGSEQLDNVQGPRVNNYTGKDVMLHTGNSLGFEPTATGSNSSRSGAYDQYLDGRGREMITFNFGELHTDRSGTDFFCQWYDDAAGKSAVAFTYRRGPQG